ncbi:hypothetical protein [Paenibacillus kobensis]|uniref:hypothetical protein n=1 Tax=Paenibacillus kobensis TaxID=59841 RepID=UPI000FDC504D|nr:hypothetical protein [Paenibacillus kobensis]
MSLKSTGLKTHLFQVEILVEGDTNAKALEQLLHVLNNGGFPDFRVLSGSELGRLIDQLQQQATVSSPSKSVKNGSSAGSAEEAVPPHTQTAKSKSASSQSSSSSSAKTASRSTAAAAETPANPFALIAAQFREYMSQNKLIRLRINKGLGVSLNIPGRIINLDEEASLITVYHVDEKQVYTFKLNEIDDYSI